MKRISENHYVQRKEKTIRNVRGRKDEDDGDVDNRSDHIVSEGRKEGGES